MRNILLLSLFLLITSSLCAQSVTPLKVQAIRKEQSAKTVLTTDNQVYPLQLSSSNIPEVTTEVYNNPVDNTDEKINVAEEPKTAEYCDEMIRSIEVKIEWVKNHPLEHTRALETGWYIQMQNHIEGYQKAKEELTK